MELNLIYKPIIGKPYIYIYTDGSCSPNPGPGGYGWVMLNDKQDIVTEGFGSNKFSTNNVMEMVAVLDALDNLTEPHNVNIISDSEYVVKGLNDWAEHWFQTNKPGIKNRQLWLKLLKHKEVHYVNCSWIRGHSGNKWNEYVDKLALSKRHEEADKAVSENRMGYYQRRAFDVSMKKD